MSIFVYLVIWSVELRHAHPSEQVLRDKALRLIVLEQPIQRVETVRQQKPKVLQ